MVAKTETMTVGRPQLRLDGGIGRQAGAASCRELRRSSRYGSVVGGPYFVA
jgi:hypothetical protein